MYYTKYRSFNNIQILLIPGILSFMITLVLGLLFSALFRIDKNKNHSHSIQQFMIAQSAAGSNDQIIQQGHDESEFENPTNLSTCYQKHIYDGFCFYDPSLLHPIVHQLCCCPRDSEYQDAELQAEIR